MTYPYQRHKALKIILILSLFFAIICLYNAFCLGFSNAVIPSNFTNLQFVNWRINKCYYFLDNERLLSLSGHQGDDEVYRWNIDVLYFVSLDGNTLTLDDGVESITLSFVSDKLYSGNNFFTNNGVVDLGIEL